MVFNLLFLVLLVFSGQTKEAEIFGFSVTSKKQNQLKIKLKKLHIENYCCYLVIFILSVIIHHRLKPRL
jgi:hypothetical protein